MLNNTLLDMLDRIAEEVKENNFHSIGVLSTGEKIYVALAANNIEILKGMDYTIPQALSRIGDEWVKELVKRWEHK